MVMCENGDELEGFIGDRLDAVTPKCLEVMTHLMSDANGWQVLNIYTALNDILGATCQAGVSKFVLWYKEKPNVVFKIPFIGESTIDGTLPTSGSFIGTGSWAIDNTDLDADFSPYDLDYCKIEAEMYTKVPRKLKKMFAKTEYLMTYERGPKSIPIYVSDRADTCFRDGAQGVETSQKTERTAYKLYNDVDCGMTLDALEVFIEQYGKRKTSAMLNFLSHWNIRDLHNGNIMFRHGRAVIIDYSYW